MLITIEGIDGSGKSSLINELKKLIPDAIFTQEPYGIMKQNIENYRGDIKKQAVYSLLSHADHIEKLIEPKSDKIIISERFFDNIIAYQAEAQNIDVRKFVDYQKRVSVIPDMTILLTCEVDIAYDRSGERIYDSKIFLNNVQNNYKLLAAMNQERTKIFDTSKFETNNYKSLAVIVMNYINCKTWYDIVI